MNRTFTLLFLLFLTVTAKAQVNNKVSDFGVIANADLRLNACDFEKDANAEVLFDDARVNTDDYGITVMIRHTRIKIFNDEGKHYATIKLDYQGHYFEEISDVTAQTINMVDDKVVFTPVDPKLIFVQKVSKYHQAAVFTFPDVRRGSVIEFQYKWKTIYKGNFPEWNFEADIPTRFSQYALTVPATSFFFPGLIRY